MLETLRSGESGLGKQGETPARRGMRSAGDTPTPLGMLGGKGLARKSEEEGGGGHGGGWLGDDGAVRKGREGGYGERVLSDYLCGRFRGAPRKYNKSS